MKSIIPEQSQSTIFDKLIQTAMDIFISEGEVHAVFTQSCNMAKVFIVYFHCCATDRLVKLRL